MKTCKDCIYADWYKTVAGKLHPSGDGRCTYEYKLRALPPAFRWMSTPYTVGGQINRREERNDHCIYFEKGE